MLISGFLFGTWTMFWMAWRHRKPRLPSREHHQAPARPICDCGHALAFHDMNHARVCAGDNQRLIEVGISNRSSLGERCYEWIPCPCRMYYGPEPLVWVNPWPAGHDLEAK